MTDVRPRPAGTEATTTVRNPLGGGSTAAPPDRRVDEPSPRGSTWLAALDGVIAGGVSIGLATLLAGVLGVAGDGRGHPLADPRGRRGVHRPDPVVAQGLRGVHVRDQRQAGPDRRDERRPAARVRGHRRAVQAAHPARLHPAGAGGPAGDGRGPLPPGRRGTRCPAHPDRHRRRGRHADAAAPQGRRRPAYRAVDPADPSTGDRRWQRPRRRAARRRGWTAAGVRPARRGRTP